MKNNLRRKKLCRIKSPNQEPQSNMEEKDSPTILKDDFIQEQSQSFWHE